MTNLSAFHSPIRFQPFHRPMVWGGRTLETHLKRQLASSENYGESWEISDHPSHLSVVAEGPLHGKTLRELMRENSRELLGKNSSHSSFPWLVKYLDAHDWLSVQVHPDEHKVKTLWPGEGPKNEAWLILDAKPTAKIFAGLLPGVTPQQVRDASIAGTVGELLHQFTPNKGDCVYLPAGTVHAVGGGVLIAEIQQTSDATFRLFDWNRKDSQGKSRQLHLEESMACIDWTSGPVHPVKNNPNEARCTLVKTPYFHLDVLNSKATQVLSNEGQMQVGMVLEGEGTLTSESHQIHIKPGDTFLFPASLKQVSWQPVGTQRILLGTLPN